MNLRTPSIAAVSAFFVVIAGGLTMLTRPGEAAPAKTDVPVLVELFTSEGCSSCPPADAALLQLSRAQSVPGANIVVLGYHVDYWNRLGWRDPFSSPAYTARQEAYRVRFGNDSVYTPQAVVGGAVEFVASDTAVTKAHVAKEADRLKNSPVQVTIAPEGGDTYAVSVTGAAGIRHPHLFVAVTENGLSTEVKSGENAGRHLSHVSVVRRLVPLGEKTQATVHLPVGRGETRTNQSVVAWVQTGDTGRVVGASLIPSEQTHQTVR